jgi:hypothetical protein
MKLQHQACGARRSTYSRRPRDCREHAEMEDDTRSLARLLGCNRALNTRVWGLASYCSVVVPAAADVSRPHRPHLLEVIFLNRIHLQAPPSLVQELAVPDLAFLATIQINERL